MCLQAFFSWRMWSKSLRCVIVAPEEAVLGFDTIFTLSRFEHMLPNPNFCCTELWSHDQWNIMKIFGSNKWVLETGFDHHFFLFASSVASSCCFLGCNGSWKSSAILVCETLSHLIGMAEGINREKESLSKFYANRPDKLRISFWEGKTFRFAS